MSSEIRPEDIEAAIAAAEQRRRSRLGNAGEAAAAAAAGGRRSVLPERIGPSSVPGKTSESSDTGTAISARSKSDEFDDSWLNQPIRPRPASTRFADMPESEVVWEPETNRRSLAVPFGIGVAILLIFGGILWWAYRSTIGESDGTVPVIAADEAPVKQKPAAEGGLEVPDQDKLVYNNLGQGEQGSTKVEQLLPPPEEPVKPAQPAASAATETPAPPAMTGTDEDTTAAPAPSAPAATPAAPSTSAATAAPSTAAAPAAPPPPSQTMTAETAPAAPAASVAEPAAPAAPAAATPAPAKEVAVTSPAAPATSKPAQATAGGGWKIQLASVKSDALARQQWGRLQKAHSDLLGDMRLTVQQADLGTKGTYYRIQAGPLPDRTTAEDVCAELKSAKQPCIVVKP
jgi:hypothetical protein